MWESTEGSEELLERAQAELDTAEAADDERRLKVLEDLYGALEAELARPEFAPPQN
jgi:hypothetical protein